MEKDKKDLILENFKRMKEKISSLTARIELKETELESEKRKNDHFKNLCWWDAKSCIRYTEIAGLQEAGTRCSSCHRVNEEMLNRILEENEFIRSEENINEEVKEKNEEQIEEVLQDLHEEIVNIMNETKVEPS